MIEFHATTICAVRRSADDVAIGGDGQVTMGESAIMKNGAVKVKKIFHDSVLTGFAGSVADAFSLTEKFEKKLEETGKHSLEKSRILYGIIKLVVCHNDRHRSCKLEAVRAAVAEKAFFFFF